MKWPPHIEAVWTQLGLAPDLQPADLAASGVTWEQVVCMRGVGKKTAWQIRERLLAENCDLPTGEWKSCVPKPPVVHWKRNEKAACGVALHDGLYVNKQSEATCKRCLRPVKSVAPTAYIQGQIVIKVRGTRSRKVSLDGTYQEALQRLYEVREQMLSKIKAK